MCVQKKKKLRTYILIITNKETNYDIMDGLDLFSLYRKEKRHYLKPWTAKVHGLLNKARPF
jgi:hypothetical protein